MESTQHLKLYSDVSPPITMQHSSPCGGGSGVGNGGFGCIEHTVTKFDTLAGVAIKYGVEVADIKKMNGLTTDLQMFSRKMLRIPLPGRHPPSPIILNGNHSQGQTSSETTPPNRRHSESYNAIRSYKLSSSPQRNISSSINSLQDYYRLTPNDHNNNIDKDFKTPQNFSTPLGLHRKSKSEANGFSNTHKTENIPSSNQKASASDKSIEKLVRRRKSEVDLNNHTPELLPKQDININSSILRPKTANRTSIDIESGNVLPVGSRDSSVVQAFTGVRKSSSAPSFQNSETNNSNNNNNITSSSSSWRTSMLNFTLDLQAFSTAAITSTLFDGLPKPNSGRKKKPARD